MHRPKLIIIIIILLKLIYFEDWLNEDSVQHRQHKKYFQVNCFDLDSAFLSIHSFQWNDLQAIPISTMNTIFPYLFCILWYSYIVLIIIYFEIFELEISNWNPMFYLCDCELENKLKIKQIKLLRWNFNPVFILNSTLSNRLNGKSNNAFIFKNVDNAHKILLNPEHDNSDKMHNEIVYPPGWFCVGENDALVHLLIISSSTIYFLSNFFISRFDLIWFFFFFCVSFVVFEHDVNECCFVCWMKLSNEIYLNGWMNMNLFCLYIYIALGFSSFVHFEDMSSICSTSMFNKLTQQ